MLNRLRYVAFVRIIILILLLPALSLAAEPLDRVIAIVNENVITESELALQAEELRQQILAKKMEVPSNSILRKQVLQHLIDVDLQLQLAKNNHLSVDNTELNEAIAKIAESNRLSLTRLREEINKQGLNWENYRENIRKEILISRVQQNAVGQDVVISSQQIDDYMKTMQHHQKKTQTYHLHNIVIPLPEAPTSDQVQKAKQKARALFNQIKQGADFNRVAIEESSGEYALEGGDLGPRYLAELPDLFAERVLRMKVGEIAGPIRTGNGFQLIKLTKIGGEETHHEVLKSHVRHILLKPETSMTEAEAQKQANNLYQQLKSGKDFALMAKQYSLDAASAVKGGDLGWVTEETLVPTFAKAMAALPLHTVSKPVKSPFGWHLIEVLERKKIDDSEAYQRQKIRQFLQQRKFTEAVQNWQQHLRTDAFIKILDKELT